MIEIKLRQSWINTYLRCPEQARQERLGLVTQKQTSDLLRGNAVHEAIEWAGLVQQGGEEEVTLDKILDVCDDYLAKQGQHVDVWRQSYEDTVDVCRDNLTAWYYEVYPLLIPQAVEKTFSKSMGVRNGVKLVLTGTADWIDKSGVIWDWKNPSRHYEAWEKNVGIYNHTRILGHVIKNNLIYALWLREKFKLLKSRVVKNRKKHL